MQTARIFLELQQVDLDILRDRKAYRGHSRDGPDPGGARQAEGARPSHNQDSRHAQETEQIEAEDNEGRRATLTRHVEEVKFDNSQSSDFRHIQNNNAEAPTGLAKKRLEKVEFNQRKVHEEIKRLEDLMAEAQAIKARLDAREAVVDRDL